MSTRSGSRSKTVRGALLGLAAVHVAEAIVLRRRRNRLSVVHREADANTVVTPAGRRSEADGVFVTAPGVRLDEATKAGARHLAAQTGRDVLDLVPGDLPATAALRVLRRVDPRKLGADPFFAPGGAQQAVLVASAIDAHTSRDAVAGEGDRARAPGELAADLVAWQRHAPTSSGIALAPTLAAAPPSGEDRWAELDRLHGWSKPYITLPPLLMGLEAAHLAAMVAGVVADPVAGALALATWSAQPAAVLGAQPRRPGDLRPEVVRASLFRLLAASSDWVRTARAGLAASRRESEARRARPRPVAPDPAGLFEPRREDCPWCGSGSLTNRVTTNDLLQHKPGEFKLDRCDDCGHTFQNPRLSLAGLDYYYDEFYDGQAAELLEVVFQASAASYRDRAAAIAAQTTPVAWLDVGAGHGHFCLSARQRWPEVIFDGLDLSDSIVEAERRGWIDTGYVGLFPDLASGLPRSYDVVSMNHYLEHTRCPQDELDAAAKVLEPGGHLLIELPDPECSWSRPLGRFWLAYFQPQHQHLIPLGNLCAALIERNFEIVSVERSAANQPVHLAASIFLRLEDLLPSPKLPWLPPASLAHRVGHGAMFLAGSPVIAAAAAFDQAMHLVNRNSEKSNTYRVVARRI